MGRKKLLFPSNDAVFFYETVRNRPIVYCGTLISSHSYTIEPWTISTNMIKSWKPLDVVLEENIKFHGPLILRIIKLWIDLVLQVIQTRQLGFLGHVTRREYFENLCLTGKLEGTGARGRQRLKHLESICRRVELQMSPIELLKYTQDRAFGNAFSSTSLVTGHQDHEMTYVHTV